MNFRAFLAEFIGTMTLVLVGTVAIAIGKFAYSDSGLVGIALASGLAYGVMVSATAAISGGHLNPAVTLGLLTAKKIDGKNAIGYLVAQLAGGVFGAFLASMTGPKSLIDPVMAGLPFLHKDLSSGQGVLVEAIATFFLVFVVMGTLTDGRPSKMGGLLIGLTISMDVLFCGPLTGAAMNPARWLGPAVIGSNYVNAMVWIIGPLVGGILAAVIYNRVLEQKTHSAA